MVGERKTANRWLIPCVGLLGSVAAATSARGQAPQSRPVPAELIGFHERWESAMKELGIPGLAYALVRGNELLYVDTIGVRDPQTGKPVTPDTLFYIASCTKSFVAMTIMALVEDGKVSLDAPV